MKIEFYDKKTGLSVDGSNLFIDEDCQVYEDQTEVMFSPEGATDIWDFLVDVSDRVGFRTVE